MGGNTIMNLILVGPMGHKGLALATSISAIATTLLLIYDLNKKLGNIDIKNYLICFIKTMLASVIMGVIVYLVYGKFSLYVEGKVIFQRSLFIFIRDVLVLGLTIGIGGLIYLVLCYLFKVDEINMIVNKVKTKVKK